MQNITFYTNPMSRGQIARWMLEEVGVVYDQVILEYGNEMKSPDYLAINPMGKVPTIQHGNQIITECAAICAYLADVLPEANLAPPLDQRADYYRWLFFAAGPLESAITNKSLGFKHAPEQQRMAGFGTYELTINVLDDFLSHSDYVCGNTFTAADVYLGSHIDFGLMFNSIEHKDSFVAYAERLRDRPAYQRAKQLDAILTQQQG